MKRILVFILAAALALAAGCSGPANSPSGTAGATETPSTEVSTEETPATLTSGDEIGAMTVTSGGINEGFIDPAYGANGVVREGDLPVLSLPLEISGAPEGTVCFAVYMDDPDAEPLCGYRWVHWMAVNIMDGSLPEDFSRTAGSAAVQGKNDSGTAGYAGPMPPDKDHTYVITVYALDAPLALTDGFTKEEFTQALEGHVLGEATIEGVYKK